MLGWIDIAARLRAAAPIGGSIGLDRYAHHKSAGLRTLSLVATGAAALSLQRLIHPMARSMPMPASLAQVSSSKIKRATACSG
jgi:uncharacterized membrane protein YhiD involved in acid resistance